MTVSAPRSSMRAALTRFREAALDLVFPPRCVSCDSYGAFICDPCRPLFLRSEPPRCATCWTQDAGPRCESCRHRRPAFAAARSAFVYEGPARDAVLALKFRGISAIAKTMAVPMAERLVAWDPPVSAIVPVPLASPRKRARGYNQSELLAREIGRFTALPVVTDALVKPRATPPQVGQPDWIARRSNVAAAFAPGRRRIEAGVLLVDDVITTGATLDACATCIVLEAAPSSRSLSPARISRPAPPASVESPARGGLQ